MSLFIFRKVKSAAEHMERRAKGGMSSEDAWNESSIELVAASTVCFNYFLLHVPIKHMFISDIFFLFLIIYYSVGPLSCIYGREIL